VIAHELRGRWRFARLRPLLNDLPFGRSEREERLDLEGCAVLRGGIRFGAITDLRHRL